MQWERPGPDFSSNESKHSARGSERTDPRGELQAFEVTGDFSEDTKRFFQSTGREIYVRATEDLDPDVVPAAFRIRLLELKDAIDIMVGEIESGEGSLSDMPEFVATRETVERLLEIAPTVRQHEPEELTHLFEEVGSLMAERREFVSDAEQRLQAIVSPPDQLVNDSDFAATDLRRLKVLLDRSESLLQKVQSGNNAGPGSDDPYTLMVLMKSWLQHSALSMQETAELSLQKALGSAANS
ncbi:MAG: hypothetical protein JST12_14365 [Armatimonadetes bacterium]|nr:hypothetical protein [Armatimonadota bacterium]